MKKIAVFQHVPYEILGTLHPLIKEAGIRMRYANFGRHPDAKVTVSNYDGLVILGGPMGVWETEKHPHLKREIEYIRIMMELNRPVLGICLGAQLIAAALGAEVQPAKEREIGWYDVHLTTEGQADPLLSCLNSEEKIFQWHFDEFALPQNSVWLAQSKNCRNQAFRHGDKTYGFQFHLEVDHAMIERWLHLPAHRKIVSHQDETKIRNDTAAYIPRGIHLGTRVFTQYLNLFSTKRKKILLTSKT